MKTKHFILFLGLFYSLTPLLSFSQKEWNSKLDFYGDTITLKQDFTFVDYGAPLSEESIRSFYAQMNKSNFSSVLNALLQYRQTYQPDDWLYYQLIRKIANHLSPKAANYHRYTLYKWYFLTKSGFDAILAISGSKLLFYVQSDENIYNIPFRMRDGRQYVCLNYHDYGAIDFSREKFTEMQVPVPEAKNGFSYKVNRLPHFNSADYIEKELLFTYNENEYQFKIKLNPQVKTIFANYPVLDYEYYFNTPLSSETYRSFIPELKKTLKGMNHRQGIDYLMHFTRNAFAFRPDREIFGQEKRFSPEQTLLYEQSDCEDRAALFFYLVKEIYNLPMIIMVFPEHVTIGVKLDKPVGKPILHNGVAYSVCEPTPQKEELRIGQLAPGLSNTPYQVVYAYDPN